MAVVRWIKDEKFVAAIFAWQVLLATWGSMQFDDCLHIDPASLVLEDTALYATALKSKRDQGRKGTRYVICRVTLSDVPWMDEVSKCMKAGPMCGIGRAISSCLTTRAWRQGG